MERLLKKFDTAKTPGAARRSCATPTQPTRLGAIYYGSTSPAMNEADEMLAEQRHRISTCCGCAASRSATR